MNLKKKIYELRIQIFNEWDQESLLFRHKKEVQKISFLVPKTRKTIRNNTSQNSLFSLFRLYFYASLSYAQYLVEFDSIRIEKLFIDSMTIKSDNRDTITPLQFRLKKRKQIKGIKSTSLFTNYQYTYYDQKCSTRNF